MFPVSTAECLGCMACCHCAVLANLAHELRRRYCIAQIKKTRRSGTTETTYNSGASLVVQFRTCQLPERSVDHSAGVAKLWAHLLLEHKSGVSAASEITVTTFMY